MQIFIDILWYCRQLFAKKGAKNPQCDDTPSFENGFYDTPSDAILTLLTALQLLALNAVGVNITRIRAASMFAMKALDLAEIISTSTPVNKWKSESTIIQKLVPQAVSIGLLTLCFICDNLQD